MEKGNWGGKRPGQGRPKKEQRNVKRQISVPPELDEKIKSLAESEGNSYSATVVKLILRGLRGLL